MLGIQIDKASLDGSLISRVRFGVLGGSSLAGTSAGGDHGAVLEAGHAAELAGKDAENDRQKESYRDCCDNGCRIIDFVATIVVV